MQVSASQLRNNVYRLLDQVATTGTPLVVERKGRRLRIVCEDAPSRLARLVPHECIAGDPEALVHCDWSTEWHRDLP
jgi:hypothetical protein